MKSLLSLGFALLALAPAQAQIFRSEAVNGAVLGGIAGGIIGHNSGDLRHNGWRGAAIGSAAGLLIGQAVGDARAEREYARGGYPDGGYIYRSAPSVSIGVGYGGYSGRGYRGHHVPYRHGYSWGISYGPAPYYRGAGWGYARYGYPYYGYGDVVYRSAPVIVQAAQPVVESAPAPQPQAAPQQVTIINNYYNTSTPMTSANTLFGR